MSSSDVASIIHSSVLTGTSRFGQLVAAVAAANLVNVGLNQALINGQVAYVTLATSSTICQTLVS